MEPEIYQILQSKGLSEDEAFLGALYIMLKRGCDGNCNSCHRAHDDAPIIAFGTDVSPN